jgi:hypothetical protein
MMSKVKRHILKCICWVLCSNEEFGNAVAQEAFILGQGIEELAGHFYDFCGGVVAGPGEFYKFRGLDMGEPEVGGGELNDDFVGGWVLFAEVGGITEAEGGGSGGDFEGAGKFCCSLAQIIHTSD